MTLVEHSIRVAHQVHGIDKVYVSTESDEVASVAGAAGASIIWRDRSLSRDGVTNETVLAHAVAMLRASGEINPELIVLLQPTHPFREPNEVQAALDQMRSRPTATALISVVRLRQATSTVVDGWWKEPAIIGRNIKKPVVFMNLGNFYVFRVALTVDQGQFFGEHVLSHEVRQPHIDIDIDEFADLELARVLARNGPQFVGLGEPIGPNDNCDDPAQNRKD